MKKKRGKISPFTIFLAFMALVVLLLNYVNLSQKRQIEALDAQLDALDARLNTIDREMVTNLEELEQSALELTEFSENVGQTVTDLNTTAKEMGNMSE